MFVRKGKKLGSVLVGQVASTGDPTGPHRVEPESEPEPDPQPDPVVQDRADGVHSVGGGWHEIVIGGEVIDKIRGADAAQEAFEAYIQSDPGEEADDGD